MGSLIYWCIFFNFLECLLLLLLTVLFSLFANNILSSLISFLLLVLGHAVQETQGLNFVKTRPSLSFLLDIYHLILPGFYKLNLKDFVIYQQYIDPDYLYGHFLYGIFYSFFLLTLIVFIFNKKNLD